MTAKDCLDYNQQKLNLSDLMMLEKFQDIFDYEDKVEKLGL